jgi:hypothetical protein
MTTPKVFRGPKKGQKKLVEFVFEPYIVPSCGVATLTEAQPPSKSQPTTANSQSWRSRSAVGGSAGWARWGLGKQVLGEVTEFVGLPVYMGGLWRPRRYIAHFLVGRRALKAREGWRCSSP